MGIEYNRLMRSDVANLALGVRVGLKYLNYVNILKGGNFFSDNLYAGLGAYVDLLFEEAEKLKVA